MQKFLIGYLTFLCAIGATFGTVFVAGMIHASLNGGHIDTALVAAVAWLAILPVLICATIMCGQSFTEIMRRSR